ncbi:MAG TPA: rhodanese-like domain-containing protein [Bacteroidales bacterium]|nr:rhodanese-like domain-containing protein [Bacteroidales bacterium]
MKPRIILAAFILPLALIIAAVPQNKTKPYKLSANQLLEKAISYEQYVTPDNVADLLIKKDPTLRLIDVRTPAEFEKFSLPGAVNIPLSEVLSDSYRDIIDQDVKMNVFYSNGTLNANEAWMITRQLGYKNNYVLQGGLNYWAETIMNPKAPEQTSPDEEIARYNFRKGASQALGGAVETSTASMEVKVPEKPVLTRKTKKKRIAGGC